MEKPERPSSMSLRVLTVPDSSTVVSTESFVLGSDPSCDMAFAGPGVSRRHAELHRVGDLWWVRDLGTEGGTYLDGEIIEAAPVAGESILALGIGGPSLLLTPTIPERTVAGHGERKSQKEHPPLATSRTASP